jgi:adenine-specific DNA methylase
MIPKECKRLAEVDFPIAVVSKHSAREKSIRHGHPSTLHLWWARRPLAACRAMLMALLLPDSCDPLCPKEFRSKAREALLGVPGWNIPRINQQIKSNEGLRKALLTFIGDFANWDNSSNTDYISIARALVKAAHPDETPLVADPFAGGGSIPLEALRLGCETFASDLNPVACLILKVMLEDIPRHGPELAEELRRVGGEIKKQAEKELAEFYPKYPDGATPIAYLWARTIKCESPNCGAEIPLMRSFWLCKKASRKRALNFKVVRSEGVPPHVEFEIFEPKADKDVHGGTVTRAKATCPCCNMVLPPERVRAQLSEQRGGADVVFDTNGNRIGGARMLSVVTLHPGIQGRNYRLPTQDDYLSVWKAKKRLKTIIEQWERNGKKGLCPVPDEPLPLKNTNCFRIPNYGIRQWKDIATVRQQLSLHILSTKLLDIANVKNKANYVAPILGLAVSRCSDFNSSLNSWAASGEFVRSTFARQALSMVWDFCETMTLTTESGGFDGALSWVERVTESLAPLKGNGGQVEQADACKSPLPDETVSIWFTDPPYYDAVGYAELSDFFFVWLKRGLLGYPLLRDPFDLDNPLVPKTRECVQDENYRSVEGTPKDRSFFEGTMGSVFGEGRRVVREDGIGSVVFAHKTTEGWEALLAGMIHGGWTITGSWPIATERPGRLRSQESAALATSVHLVCRPRSEDAPVGDWGDVLRELPNRVGNWMERLQSEKIRGADLVFACIGPALEIFSRYRKVETADGQEVKLAEYLEKVWEVVGRMALEQVLGTEEAKARNGAAGALEEDARLTALFLWTLQSTNGNGEGKSKKGKVKSEEIEENERLEEDDEEDAPKGKAKGYSLIFDVARRFAQPLGIDLPKWENRIIKTEKGVVRLLPVSERAKQLFGEDGTKAAAEWITQDPAKRPQISLFPEMERVREPIIRGRGRGKINIDPSAIESNSIREATTLDRVHAAMLLQAGGQANALRALIKAEQDRGSDFLRLANALSALYPTGSEEKRLLDAMLLAVPR